MLKLPSQIGVLATSAVFGLIGGYVSGLRPAPATAQTVISGPPNNHIQIKQDDYLIVPQSGFRFVDEHNQLVMIIGAKGGSATLALMDGAGNPSITLVSGSKGQMILSTDKGASIVTGLRGDERRVIVGAAQGVTGMAIVNGSAEASIFGQADSTGAIFQLVGKSGKRVATIREMPTGGVFQLSDKTGEVRAALESATFGKLFLTSTDKKSGVTMSGAGTAEGSSPEGSFKLPVKSGS